MSFVLRFYSGEPRVEADTIETVYNTVVERWPDWSGYFQMAEDDHKDHLIVWRDAEAAERFDEPVALVCCTEGTIRQAWGEHERSQQA